MPSDASANAERAQRLRKASEIRRQHHGDDVWSGDESTSTAENKGDRRERQESGTYPAVEAPGPKNSKELAATLEEKRRQETVGSVLRDLGTKDSESVTAFVRGLAANKGMSTPELDRFSSALMRTIPDLNGPVATELRKAMPSASHEHIMAVLALRDMAQTDRDKLVAMIKRMGKK